MIEHAAAETGSARVRGDGDLPDKKFILFVRRAKAGNPPRQTSTALGEDAGFGEIAALEEVAIEGIGIKRRAGGNQPRDVGGVRAGGAPEGFLRSGYSGGGRGGDSLAVWLSRRLINDSVSEG